ncbi:MAG: class I SAM-dependent methyltransferase [Steroidobacteraceae bacterium]
MYDINEQTSRDHLLDANLEERTRQAFAKHLRQFVFGTTRGVAQQAFAQRVAPELARKDPAAARDRKRAREALLQVPEYQFFCDLHRISQEQIWNSTADSVERDADRLRAEFLALRNPKGSLQLNPELQIPEYLLAMDTHCMPGSYHTDWAENDLSNGALYERGSFLYTPSGGPANDGAGRASLDFLRTKLPDFVPRRMLDLGCATCSPLFPYARAFPGTEIHAVDSGAPVLRYAHLHAEKEGITLHLRQADAAATGYEDGMFDLVTAHIMFHETESYAIPQILAEAYRVLAPGGVLLIVDLPNAGLIPDVFQQIVFDGDAYYNNEHFWMRMHDLDWAAELRKVGFPAESIEIGAAPMQMYIAPSAEHPEPRWNKGRFGFFAVMARKAAAGSAK